jgi:hypothetical protein
MLFSSITNFGAIHGDKAFFFKISKLRLVNLVWMIQLLKEQSYHNKQGRTPSMGLMTYHVAFFYWFSSLLVRGERLVEWFHILRHVHQVLLFELCELIFWELNGTFLIFTIVDLKFP